TSLPPPVHRVSLKRSLKSQPTIPKQKAFLFFKTRPSLLRNKMAEGVYCYQLLGLPDHELHLRFFFWKPVI
ncbi:hypothetical protein MKW98_018419, partial [Papaver atlanticum]